MDNNKPPYIKYNPPTAKEPCDVYTGPCCCGAWHTEEEWTKDSRNLGEVIKFALERKKRDEQ